MEFTKLSETTNTVTTYGTNGSETITTKTEVDKYSSDNAEYRTTFSTHNGALQGNILVQIFERVEGGVGGSIGNLSMVGEAISQSGLMPFSSKYPIYAAEFIEVCNDIKTRIEATAEEVVS